MDVFLSILLTTRARFYFWNPHMIWNTVLIYMYYNILSTYRSVCMCIHIHLYTPLRELACALYL